MQSGKRSHLLVLTDRVGISDGYRSIWEKLCNDAGLTEHDVRISVRSTYRTFSAREILQWKPPSKLPGFRESEGTQAALRNWVRDVIAAHNPDAILCMDPALLFLYNPVWNEAKLDTLRGGVYVLFEIPHIVCLPVTAFYNKAKPKDIAKLNEGFTEKGDFTEYQNEVILAEDEYESEDDDEVLDRNATFDKDSDDDKHVIRHMMQWHDPVVVPYGRMVLNFDLSKTARILKRIRDNETNT